MKLTSFQSGTDDKAKMEEGEFSDDQKSIRMRAGRRDKVGRASYKLRRNQESSFTASKQYGGRGNSGRDGEEFEDDGGQIGPDGP